MIFLSAIIVTYLFIMLLFIIVNVLDVNNEEINMRIAFSNFQNVVIIAVNKKLLIYIINYTKVNVDCCFID